MPFRNVELDYMAIDAPQSTPVSNFNSNFTLHY